MRSGSDVVRSGSDVVRSGSDAVRSGSDAVRSGRRPRVPRRLTYRIFSLWQAYMLRVRATVAPRFRAVDGPTNGL